MAKCTAKNGTVALLAYCYKSVDDQHGNIIWAGISNYCDDIKSTFVLYLQLCS